MHSHILRVTILAVTLSFFGCKSSKLDINENTLAEFHLKYISPSEPTEPPSDSLRVFIDYSDGMYEAIRSQMNFMRAVLAIANDPATRYYRVGANESPEPVSITDPRYIPWSLSSYKDIRSVLDSPLDSIVSHPNGTSVYITDFELVKNPTAIMDFVQNGKVYKTQIDISPWATNRFSQWLKAGNSIDVFAGAFTRLNFWTHTSQNQHVYVIVFTPRRELNNPNAIVNRIATDKLVENSSGALFHFSFSLVDFRFKQNYPGVDRGGLHDNLNAFEIYNHATEHFEYYYLNLKELDALNGDKTLTDKRILHNLQFERIPQSFKDLDVGVRVYDITHEFARFLDWKASSLKPRPTNPEPGQGTPADTVLSTYTPQLGPELPEMFEAAFNRSQRELGIKLHTNYSSPGKNNFYLVSIVILDPKFSQQENSREVLSWTDARGFEVSSLFTSLNEAMERNAPRNSTLYNYYIRF